MMFLLIALLALFVFLAGLLLYMYLRPIHHSSLKRLGQVGILFVIALPDACMMTDLLPTFIVLIAVLLIGYFPIYPSDLRRFK